MPFEDITIIGLDDAATQPSQTSPVHRLMHLTLSDLPSEEWSQLFEEQFNSHMNSRTYRRTRVDRECLIVDCPPEEMNQARIDSLRGDVAATNARYRQIVATQDRENATALADERKEQERLKEIKDGLKF